MNDHNTDTKRSVLDDDSSCSVIVYSYSVQCYHESDNKLSLNSCKKYFEGKDETKWLRRPQNQIIKVVSVNHLTKKHEVK